MFAAAVVASARQTRACTQGDACESRVRPTFDSRDKNTTCNNYIYSSGRACSLCAFCFVPALVRRRLRRRPRRRCRRRLRLLWRINHLHAREPRKVRIKCQVLFGGVHFAQTRTALARRSGLLGTPKLCQAMRDSQD